MVKMCGGLPLALPTLASNNYELTADALRTTLQQHPGVSCIILCNPSNPSGGVASKQSFQEIALLLQDFPQVFTCISLRQMTYIYLLTLTYQCVINSLLWLLCLLSITTFRFIFIIIFHSWKVVVLSDEIYERLTYDGVPHTSMAAIDHMFERTITINGFSKSHSMTGYRIGALSIAHLLTSLLRVLFLLYINWHFIEFSSNSCNNDAVLLPIWNVENKIFNDFVNLDVVVRSNVIYL